MRPASTLALSLCALALSLAACSAGGGGAIVASYAVQCMSACKAPSDGACAGQTSAAECQEACTMETAGLTASCAQCLLTHTGWMTSTCVCDMNGCKTCGTSPGFSSVPCTGGEGFMCEPGSTCAGYRVGTAADCESACAKPGDGGPSQNK